jgi:HSP20 family protein
MRIARDGPSSRPIRGIERRRQTTTGLQADRCGERGTGRFLRTIELPKAVNTEKVGAKYHNVILSGILPKTERARARKISVKTNLKKRDLKGACAMAEKEMVQGQKPTPVPREEVRAPEHYPKDIFETEETLTLMADLPGIERVRPAVHPERGTLTIKGVGKRAVPGDPLFTEFSVTNSCRQFELPEELDPENPPLVAFPFSTR